MDWVSGRALVRVVTIGAITALLAGCVAFGDISPHVDAIDQSVGTSLNQAILLNIVRASRNEPLYFTSVTQVSGSGTADLKTGLPNIVIGAPPPATLLFSNNGDNSQSTNFQVGVLNSSDFYKGLLNPITLLEANLLLHQGFSREMVFTLLVDKGRVHAGKIVTDVNNDPGDPSYGNFKGLLQLALSRGLTLETQRMPNPDLPAGGGKGPSTGGQSSTPAVISFGKPCFDQALAEPEYAEFARSSPAACTYGNEQTPARKGRIPDLVFNIEGGPKSFDVVMRSPYQVFQFLGAMLDRGTAEQVTVGDEKGEQEPLMVVSPSAAAGPCFTEVNYNGADYCIPEKGSERTREVFSLLNQILALNTSTADLPATPTVQITQ